MPYHSMSTACSAIIELKDSWMTLRDNGYNSIAGMFPPDRKLYPVYDDWLQTSLRAEPVEYFREVFSKNLDRSLCRVKLDHA
ncbi:MAG: hypothetical protein U0892_15530 [Pirellulales bacterium]